MGHASHECMEAISVYFGIRFYAAKIVHHLAWLRANESGLPPAIAFSACLAHVMQDQQDCMCIAAGPEYWAQPHQWN